MKKNILLSFLLFSLLPLILPAQTLPLKCGMFYDHGWTKAVSTGQCQSYNIPANHQEYYVQHGMTLGSIEEQICRGIYQTWTGTYPGMKVDLCYLTRKSSSEFEIHSYGQVNCWKDNTWFSLQCLADFKLEKEEPCEVPGPQPGDPSLIYISTRVPCLTPSEKELWSGTEEDTPPVIKICADGSKATRIEFTSNNPSVRPGEIRFLVESDPNGLNP
jgi:hypothetical protein